MKSKTTIRYLGAAIAIGAMLLPLSSQADVYWSLNLGDGLRISQRYHPVHYQHREVRYYGHKHRHHSANKLRQYYWRHRVQQHHYYAPHAYGFIPRHRSHSAARY